MTRRSTVSARRHADRVHYCVLCQKQCRGNGGKTSHAAMHERRNELVQWGKPGDLERDHYKAAKSFARRALEYRRTWSLSGATFMSPLEERTWNRAHLCFVMALARRSFVANEVRVIAMNLTKPQRRWLEAFARGDGYGARGGTVVLRSLEAKGLARPTHGWQAGARVVGWRPLTVTITDEGMRELGLPADETVECPECGFKSRDVVCEDCGSECLALRRPSVPQGAEP